MMPFVASLEVGVQIRAGVVKWEELFLAPLVLDAKVPFIFPIDHLT